MSFIQCKNEAEVEIALKSVKHGFVTEDFRIYDSIQLSDDQIYTDMDAEMCNALLELKQTIEMYGEDGTEMSFLEVEKAAEYMATAYRKVAALLKKGKS